MDKTELHIRINEAVSAFWETKQEQLDGFIDLLIDIAIQQGVPEECIYVSIMQRCLMTHP